MKKFWNLMLVALVIIGAAACTENYENVEKAEGFSFYAEVVNGTRATIADENGDKTWETKWELGDKLYVNETFEFVCTDVETGKFTCYNDAVAELVGQDVTVTTDGSHHSLQGASAFYTTATVVNFGEGKVALQALTSFFRYTYNGTNDVKLTLSEAAFRKADGTATNEIEVVGKTGDQFVAFWPTGNEVTFSYSINGVECKSATKEFKAGMVYNVGTLFESVESDWELSNGVRFYTTETADLFVAKNVKLSETKFCLHKVGDTAWGAGAKYGLVTAGTKSENTAIGLYSCSWAGDITISNATTTAHDFYFDRANSRLYVMTVGKTPDTVAAPTHSNWYNIAGSMNNWGSYNAAQKFTYSGDNVWHLVIDFKANDEFKVQLKNNWNNTCYGHNQIQANVGRSLSSGSDNAKIKTAGTYEIWVIPSHSDAPLYIIKR